MLRLSTVTGYENWKLQEQRTPVVRGTVIRERSEHGWIIWTK